MKDLYQPEVLEEVQSRITRLRPDSQPQWGRMNASQLLAHLALTMDYALGAYTLPRHMLGRLIGRFALRSMIVKGKPMGRNAPTHPRVVVTDARNFELERNRLQGALERFARGPEACTKHPHFFFGRMSPEEWSKFSYVHLDHHLRQFGV